jgi:RND family efflux transporter MFP subunit
MGKMKTMNIETVGWRPGATEGGTSSETIVVVQRRRRRNIIIAALVGLILVAATVFVMMGRNEDKANALAADAKGKGAEARPAVTVVVPGRQQVAQTISATGTLAARRDMPVSIAGEGGLVTRVLVDAGDWVSAGQTMAVVERSVQAQEAQQLAASVEVARADARLAQQELERAQTLVDRGFVSKADVQRRTATRDAANARVKVAQAQLGASRARIGRLDIRAPAGGLVLERRVEPGQVVGGASGALFRVAQGGALELRAQLSESDLALVPVGATASVTPVGTAQTFTGQVWQVSPIINEQNRQGIARVALAYDRALRPGGFAAVQIISGSREAPLLPESAILSDEKGNYVYIVGNGNKVQRRPVKTGSVTPAGIAVIEGLNGNERVVLRAGGFLNPDETVRPQRQKI